MDIFWKIIIPIITFIITGFLGWIAKQLAAMRKADQERDSEMLAQLIETKVVDRIQPFVLELESLKGMIQDAIDREEDLKTELLASYKFRLMQLCREIIAQRYITQEQYDQLTEFYKLYAHLGGNGQGKKYYDSAISLPIGTPVQNPQNAFRNEDNIK